MIQVLKMISTFIGYPFKCRHFTSMDVKFTNTNPWFIPCEYLIFASYPIFTFWRTYNHTWLKNKMWGFSIKIPLNCSHKVYVFAFQKFDKKCTPFLIKILWTLEILKILELGVLNFSELFNKRWNFICDDIFGPK